MLLTIPQVAAHLQCHRSTVYGHMRAGRLAWVKLGALRRVRESELERFIAAHDQGGAK